MRRPDVLFNILADPTRQAILERPTREGEQSVRAAQLFGQTPGFEATLAALLNRASVTFPYQCRARVTSNAMIPLHERFIDWGARWHN